MHSLTPDYRINWYRLFHYDFLCQVELLLGFFIIIVQRGSAFPQIKLPYVFFFNWGTDTLGNVSSIGICPSQLVLLFKGQIQVYIRK